MNSSERVPHRGTSAHSHGGAPSSAQNLAPTLTEVVEVWESGPIPLDSPRSESALMTESFRGRWDASGSAAVVSQGEFLTVTPAFLPPQPLHEDQIVQRVMLELQRQIDLMLEVRLREALMPVLARATDALVIEVRNELASTLRAVVETAVANSVAQESARHRKL